MGYVSSQEGRSPKLCRKKSGWTVMIQLGVGDFELQKYKHDIVQLHQEPKNTHN